MGAFASPVAPAESLQAGFLTLLPAIERHARVAFRDVFCPDRRADCVAETCALAWAWYRRLAQRGKDAAGFVGALATLAARAVRCGRRLTGQEPARDLLSGRAQRRYGFSVGPLPEVSTLDGNAWDEALQDNTRSPIPDQVWFRVDFPRWRRSRSERDRRLLDALVRGERTQDVARQFGLSAGRVSQLRREFYADWQRFHGESVAAPPPA